MCPNFGDMAVIAEVPVIEYCSRSLPTSASAASVVFVPLISAHLGPSNEFSSNLAIGVNFSFISPINELKA